MTLTSRLRLLPRGPRRSLGAVGRCIYCGTTEGRLSDEHIVPLALGGVDILEAASCAECAALTSQVERRIARSPGLWPLRRALDLPSRRPNKQPNAFCAKEIAGNAARDVSIPVSRYPLAVPFFVFDRPAFVTGAQAPPHTVGRIMLWMPTPLRNPARLELAVGLDAHDVARLIAKIGLGYAVADVGLSTLEAIFVRDLIIGREQRGNVHVGAVEGRRLTGNRLHTAEVARDGSLVSTKVQLFRPPHAHKPTPVYEVIVGRTREAALNGELDSELGSPRGG